MTNRIRVVPNTPDAVGMRHPQDGALEATGSLWAYDTFTLQRMHAGSIRHAEHAEQGEEQSVEETPRQGEPDGGSFSLEQSAGSEPHGEQASSSSQPASEVKVPEAKAAKGPKTAPRGSA